MRGLLVVCLAFALTGCVDNDEPTDAMEGPLEPEVATECLAGSDGTIGFVLTLQGYDSFEFDGTGCEEIEVHVEADSTWAGDVRAAVVAPDGTETRLIEGIGVQVVATTVNSGFYGPGHVFAGQAGKWTVHSSGVGHYLFQVTVIGR